MTGNRPKQAIRRISVGLLASLVLVAPFALAPATADPGCGVVTGNWTTLPAPRFPTGAGAIRAFTIDPRRPSRMFASNGDVVMRSANGGCDWTKVFEPDIRGLPLDAVRQTIEQIVVPEAGGGRVYVLLEEVAGPVKRPRVVRSDDGGGSWQPADAGLPPAGDPAFLRVAPSDPTVVYLAVGVQNVVELLFGSDDGGTTWTLRNNFARSIEAGVGDIKIDPINPQEVWLGASDGLYHSTDGGRSFQTEPEFTGEAIGPIDVFHAGGPASLMVFKRTGGGAVSNDGGRNWLAISSPGIPTSVIHGPVPEARMISSIEDVWVYIPNVFSWVSTRPPTRNTHGLVADRTGAAVAYGFTGSTIEVYRGPTGTDVTIPPETTVLPDPNLADPGVPPAPQPAKLTPKKRVVRIDAGDSKTVPYQLLLPKSTTPVDVYFLVDTSSSQKPFLVGLGEALQDIVNGLIRAGADAHFGLGAYDNYPDADPPRVGPPGSGPLHEPNDLYRRLVDLTRGTDRLEDEIKGIEADGGGHYNAQLEALYQTATGAGADVEPPGPGGRDVPPGLDASYRRSALRIVVLVSDEEFVERPLENDRTPPDLRRFGETVDALNEKQIHQVGISLRQDRSAPATRHMKEMARATDARAPAGGVDCDGNGAPDIGAGEPLVCEFGNSELDEGIGLSKGIVNLVESIRTRASVELQVTGRDEIVHKVTPERYESLILQASDKVTFDATFRCPLTLAGRRFPVKLTATGVKGSLGATATVVCRSVANSKDDEDEDDEVPLGFPFDPVLGLIPLVPVAPPPVITELASSTQAQAQSQAQAQAQASMAAQEQEEPQLAFVAALRRKTQEEYAMSSFTRPADMPGHVLALGGAALLMSLAAGIGLARQRTAVRVRRGRS